jgi:hypothetical protein
MVQKEAIALLALPSHPRPRFAPCPSELVQLLLHFSLAIRFRITRIASRPLCELRRLTWALRTPNVLALLADS